MACTFERILCEISQYKTIWLLFKYRAPSIYIYIAKFGKFMCVCIYIERERLVSCTRGNWTM